MVSARVRVLTCTRTDGRRIGDMYEARPSNELVSQYDYRYGSIHW